MSDESSRLTGASPGGFAARRYVADLAEQSLSNGMTLGRDSFSTGTDNLLRPMEDWRVRISLPPQSNFAFRESGSAAGIKALPSIMYPLVSSEGWGLGTDGVVFPYTPTITVQHNARYSEQPLTHSNYKSYFYEGSDIAPITIAGVFTCQNSEEAIYLMASLQFLRACAKMRFGKDDAMAGSPPTLVRVSGYGSHYLPDISCVITTVSHTMPDDCDYIKYNFAGADGWMPTSSQLSVTVQPVVSRKRQSDGISLDDFARGKLLGSRVGPGGIL